METKEKMKKLEKLAKKNRNTSVITDEVIRVLKNIVDSNPEYYLDEIATELSVQRNVFLSLSTIARTLRVKVGYSLQVCYESALQRNEDERILYKEALRLLVQNVNQLVFIDETHKDRNTARRRRVWGIRNSGGLALNRWFRQNVRYTLIAALDLDGFIPSTLEIVRRDEASNEGAAGTVDSLHFEEWIENYLLPVLGNFENSEPRSIVVMDNASTHLSERVTDLIRSKGAYLIYTAPYSPDLNPIELAFNIYKKSLKRNYEMEMLDWYEAHMLAIESVNRDICIKEYRRCGVPLSQDVKTEEELEQQRKINIALAIDLLF